MRCKAMYETLYLFVISQSFDLLRSWTDYCKSVLRVHIVTFNAAIQHLSVNTDIEIEIRYSNSAMH